MYIYVCVCVSPTKLKVVASFLLTFHFVCSLFAYSPLSLSLLSLFWHFVSFFVGFVFLFYVIYLFFVLFLSYYLLCIFSFFVFSIIDCLSFFFAFLSLSLYLPRSVSLEAFCFDFTFLFFLDLLSRSHSLGVPRLAVFCLVFMIFHNCLFSSFFLYISK